MNRSAPSNTTRKLSLSDESSATAPEKRSPSTTSQTSVPGKPRLSMLLLSWYKLWRSMESVQHPSLPSDRAYLERLREQQRQQTATPNLPQPTSRPLPAMPLPLLPNRLLDAHRAGKLALFVGSGLSLGVQGNFPTWGQLPQRLLDACERYDSLDPAALALKRQSLALRMSLEQMLAELGVLRTALRRDYQAALNDVFRPAGRRSGARAPRHRGPRRPCPPSRPTTTTSSSCSRRPRRASPHLEGSRSRPPRPRRRPQGPPQGPRNRRAVRDGGHVGSRVRPSTRRRLVSGRPPLPARGSRLPLCRLWDERPARPRPRPCAPLPTRSRARPRALRGSVAAALGRRPGHRCWSASYNVKVIGYDEHAQVPDILGQIALLARTGTP